MLPCPGVSSGLCNSLYSWCKSVLICVSGSGLEKGIEYGTHWHHFSTLQEPICSSSDSIAAFPDPIPSLPCPPLPPALSLLLSCTVQHSTYLLWWESSAVLVCMQSLWPSLRRAWKLHCRNTSYSMWPTGLDHYIKCQCNLSIKCWRYTGEVVVVCLSGSWRPLYSHCRKQNACLYETMVGQSFCSLALS